TIQRLLQCIQAEIAVATGSVDPVQEGRQINQFAPGVHEVEVEDLLACHKCESAFPRVGGTWLVQFRAESRQNSSIPSRSSALAALARVRLWHNQRIFLESETSDRPQTPAAGRSTIPARPAHAG